MNPSYIHIKDPSSNIKVKEGGDADSGGGDSCPSMEPHHALLMCFGECNVESAELGVGHAGGRRACA